MTNGNSGRIFYGWWVVAAAFLNLFFVVGIIFYGFPVFYASFVESLGFTRAQVTQGFFLGFLIIGLPSGLLAGAIIDRIGARWVIVTGAGLVGISLLLMGRMTKLWQYEALCALEVLGYVFAGPLANQVLVARWFRARRGQAMGIAYLGLGAGGVVAPLLVNYLIRVYGWRHALEAVALLLMSVLFPVGIWVTRSAPEDSGLMPDGLAVESSTAAVAAARANEAAAQQFIEQARSRQVQADANYQSAETGPQQVSSTKARVRAAIADVEQRRAQLEQAELNLQYTKIVAPVSGEVNKTVVVGLNVQPGQQLLTVVPLDQVWVTANFKETQLRHMRVGQKATIHVDSTGRTLKGHVDSIAGATGPLFSLLPPENATGNYVKIVQRVPVKIVLDQGENRDRQLRPGMNVVPDVSLR